MGRGTERVMKGSKVMLTLSHLGQTRVDFSWPWERGRRREGEGEKVVGVIHSKG